MEKEKLISLTIDLPLEMLKAINEKPILMKMAGRRSKICRFLLIKAVEKHIDLDTLDIKKSIQFPCDNMMEKYPARIGFVVPVRINKALVKLSEYYPFSKKSLTEFLIFQEFEINHTWMQLGAEAER